MEDFGDRLGLLVVEVPVGWDVARIGKLVGNVDEVGVHLSEVLPHLGRRLPVTSVPPPWEVRVGEDQIAMAVETVRVGLAVFFKG